MQLIKEKVALILIVVLVLSLSGCGNRENKENRDEFTHDRIKLLAKEMGISDFKDKNELYKEIQAMDKKSQGYIRTTGADAKEFYDLLINRMKRYSDNSISEFSVLSVGDTGMNHVYLMTFENSEKSKSFFDEFTNEFKDKREGTEKNYTYACASYENSKGRLAIYGAYLQNNNVLIIRCIDTDAVSAEDISSRLNVASPAVK